MVCVSTQWSAVLSAVVRALWPGAMAIFRGSGDDTSRACYDLQVSASCKEG